ncbi:heparinase II/III family protein [Antarcticirhabdus aurantiaca]|uniref:heparinase II/III family protein n=1 Tax=Antarcticirhabdus aurantiaca TaxID=2606717 RepID=UPI00131C6B53|nr:heparinase II/III family protein [Antarcticirhabdus aurantiaca]
MAESLVDDPRLAGLMVREAWRRARCALGAGPLTWLRLAGAAPDALVALPTPLRAGDPAKAQEIYSGTFTLAGTTAHAEGVSPFALVPSSPLWARELHAFDWLRHLAAAGDALAARNARLLVSEWIGARRFGAGRVPYEPDVASRRLIAWIAHAAFLMEGADPAFARLFLKSLGREARHVKRVSVGEAPAGLPRLRARIALAYAALCLPAGRARARAAAKALAAELDRQIFPDGGHVSRNPEAIPEILADLLPLRQLLLDAGQPVPRALYSAVDRMLPALRFFRHGDGALALFNGAGAAEPRLLAAVLRHDETMGEPISNARHSGYQRLAAGGTVLLADTGLPPAPALSGEAHAGTLGFEFSSLGQRFVVSCGAPGSRSESRRHASRVTAAHSTLTLADRSSSRFARHAALGRFLGNPLIRGPSQVTMEREDEDGLFAFRAVHDGYAEDFGLLHERRIALSAGGHRIEGTDRLAEAGRRCVAFEGRRRAAVRFHLHPSVVVEAVEGGLRLQARNHAWLFAATVEPEVEDSIFFADGSTGGGRRTSQIVLGFDADIVDTVFWSFQRELPR